MLQICEQLNGSDVRCSQIRGVLPDPRNQPHDDGDGVWCWSVFLLIVVNEYENQNEN